MQSILLRKAAGICEIVVLVAFLLMASQADAAAARRNLWQSRDQFVALERQEQVFDTPAIPNDHPADLSLESLVAQLKSITIKTADPDKAAQLFTAPSLELLAPQLRLALQQAVPDQDVTFAVIGLHSSLYGFAKSPKVTTGRCFYQGGRLNLIIGLMQQEFNERDDRRLNPFTPGSRLHALPGTGALQPLTGQAGFSLVRKDWVAFDSAWRSPIIPVALPEKQAAPTSQPAPPPPIAQGDTRQPAERLTTLKELRDKGLISAEEYQATRLKILEGL